MCVSVVERGEGLKKVQSTQCLLFLSIAIQVMGLIGPDETNYHNLRPRLYLPSSLAIWKMETSFRAQTLLRGQTNEGLS